MKLSNRRKGLDRRALDMIIRLGHCPTCGHLRTLIRLRHLLKLPSGADLESAVAAMAKCIAVDDLPPGQVDPARTAPIGQLSLFGSYPVPLRSMP